MINKIINGDCLELMSDIPDGSIDMILCDLPYGITACKWDSVIPFEPLWAQYKRVIKPNGAIVLFGSQPFTSALVMSNPKMFKYCWVWVKSKSVGVLNAKHQPLRNVEDIAVFSYKKTIYNPQGVISCNKQTSTGNSGSGNSDNYGSVKVGKYTQTQTNYPKQTLEFKSAGNTVHPTQKPVALLEYLIKTYTNEGETVLDNCMGSGSTAIAAINTNRNFIGIEKDQKYFEIACERINNHLHKY